MRVLPPHRSRPGLAASLALLAACGTAESPPTMMLPTPPTLACPKGHVSAWVDVQAGVAECQADLPLRGGGMPATGLQYPFPAMVRPAGSLNSPERIELGRLLFFDPVLSRDDTVSCAHCHSPYLGFGDGRAKAIGINNAAVPRHTPTVWNAAFSREQFWDGRAKTLEEQAGGPILNAKEMGMPNEAAVEAKVRAIPEYVKRFQTAFPKDGADAVRFANITAAIATFERTVVSFNSAYDRYAAGQQSALTASARRGLSLFNSVKLRCFECHDAPTFANPDYKVLGLPDAADSNRMDADVGRSAIVNALPNRWAFKVPTLRNVVKHAPFMHNGVFKTMDEVLDFYAKGGGLGRGYTVRVGDQDVPVPVDDKIGKYDLSAEERADLKAFLEALTDESLLPEIPAQVPSGLPVVARPI